MAIEVLTIFTLQTQIICPNSNKPTFEKPQDSIQNISRILF